VEQGALRIVVLALLTLPHWHLLGCGYQRLAGQGTLKTALEMRP
jgi:hypothetical protein